MTELFSAEHRTFFSNYTIGRIKIPIGTNLYEFRNYKNRLENSQNNQRKRKFDEMSKGNADHKEFKGSKIKKIKILMPNTINKKAKIPAKINTQAKNSLMSVADGDWWRINGI